MIISPAANNSFRSQISPITGAQKAVAKFAAANPGFVGVMNFDASGNAVATPSTAVTAPASSTSATTSLTASAKNPEQEFMDFMKETPAQQREDLWMSSHGYSKQQLAAMTPEDRQKIIDQMKQDLEQQAKDDALKPKKLNITV